MMSRNSQQTSFVGISSDPAVVGGYARVLAPPGWFRRIRRSLGGLIALLASWWRY
jgi:hypothetical protein